MFIVSRTFEKYTEDLFSFISEIKTVLDEQKFNVENHIDYNLVATNVRLMKLSLRSEKYSFMPSINVFLNHQQQNMQ